MTAQILSSELSTLIQESRRRNTELRNAAEKSLQDLKALHTTSEIQLAGDLNRRPHFITPFLIACNTHNVKFAVPAVVCLQRLSVSSALPKERLREILEAFRDCSSLGLDIQIKILQALPALLQNYSSELRGELLSIALQICSSLQNAKNPAVANTATATLQQLVSSVFDKVAVEDEHALEYPTVSNVSGDDGKVAVRAAAYDAYKVCHDLCLLTDGGKPQHVRFSSISQAACLELMESILSNHAIIFSNHPEQSYLLRTLLMPVIIRFLSDKGDFPLTLRIIRVLSVLIRNHLSKMPAECEIALGLLNHMLDPEAAVPWKRVLCMEVFQAFFTDPVLVIEIYGQYDEIKGKKDILRDTLASFVRLATEKPAVIGLGHQSTAPVQPMESAADSTALESTSGTVVIGNSNPNANAVGISAQWSTLRIPCLDHLDKAEPPTLPETYVYGLVLTCMNNLSESLAKFVLPLTVHSEGKNKKRGKVQGVPEPDSSISNSTDLSKSEKENERLTNAQLLRKKVVPVNPLSLEDHQAYPKIKTTASLISDCWPAVLATCSTFLNASLDADYYRGLVRSIQKFTQVAGLLGLDTPRDAFLTTLGKAAVPPNVLTACLSGPKGPPPESPGLLANAKGLLSVESLMSQASTTSNDKNRASIDSSPGLGARNLLCLRALLNLAIALGATLESAWSIILQTLQQADLVMAASVGRAGIRDSRNTNVTGQRHDVESSQQNLNSEAVAVQAAASRMFESTVEYPNDCFLHVLKALCELLHNRGRANSAGKDESGRRASLARQRRLPSVSGASINLESGPQDYMFALSKVGEIGSLNLRRLVQYDASESGWDFLVEELVSITAESSIDKPARLMATNILRHLVQEASKLSMPEEPDYRTLIQERALSALKKQIKTLYAGRQIDGEDQMDEVDVDIHEVVLEALKAMIEGCGESLTVGWESVFSVLLTVFRNAGSASNANSVGEDSPIGRADESHQHIEAISKRLARCAFASIELICSDFLNAIPEQSLSVLLDLLYYFASQRGDLNMSLTTITFFWNVADFLHGRTDMSTLESVTSKTDTLSSLSSHVKELSRTGSLPALWLQVPLSLNIVTTDHRTEVRNGAVHTILRIFDNYGDQLSPEAWDLCIRVVMFQMVELNLKIQVSLRSSSPEVGTEELNNWNETSKAVLSTITTLFATYIDTICRGSKFPNLWEQMIKYLDGYLNCSSFDLSAFTFSTVTGIISKVDSPDRLGGSAITQVFTLWLQHVPQGKTPAASGSNQEAFVAYVESLREIYRLTEDTMEAAAAIQVIQNLQQCVEKSDGSAYSADIDYLTPLQKQVIEYLTIFRTDIAGVPSSLIKVLSRFIVLPFIKAGESPSPPSLTFVALCKASMDLVQSTVIKHIQETKIFTDGAVTTALESLALPISRKYKWKLEGKSTPPWQKATSAALKILDPTLSHMKAQAINTDVLRSIWEQIVNISDNISKAEYTSAPATTTMSTFLSDETFDITSLKTMRDLVTPSLGSSSILDSTRRIYAHSLFRASLIHTSEPGELPSDITTSPLQNLYNIRHGCTHDSPPTLRKRLAYFALEELFSLVSQHDESAERVKLAQAAAPYLILRAALPLKAYIADTPLRGQMPAPESQRDELLFVLRRLADLECESKSIPDAEGIVGKNKKHLHRLFPLIVKAVGIRGQDGEVEVELVKLLKSVGDGFGI